LFKKKFICGGEKNKINQMKKISIKPEGNIPILIDDSLKMCRLASMLGILPFQYVKGSNLKLVFRTENFC